MNKRIWRAVASSAIVLALLTLPILPIANVITASAQYRQIPPRPSVITTRPRTVATSNDPDHYKPTAKPGSAAYYNDDRVRYSAINAKYPYRTTMDRVGGDPQVDVRRGGIIDKPRPNEEDVPVSEIMAERAQRGITGPLEVETLSGSGYLYLVTLTQTDIYGNPVIVRREIDTKKIVLTLNCGNWTREVGASYVPPPAKTIDNTCVSHPDNVGKPNYSPDGKTIVSKTYDFGCGNVETVPVETVPGDCPICKPGEAVTQLLYRVGDHVYDPDQSFLVSRKEIDNAKPFTLLDAAPQAKEAIERKFGKMPNLDIVAEIQKQTLDLPSYKLSKKDKDKDVHALTLSDFKLAQLELFVDPCPLRDGKYVITFKGIYIENGHGFPWKIVLIVGLVALGIALPFVLHGNPAELIKKTPIIPRITPP